MISDARLIGLFTGSNRPYLVLWDNGNEARFRARSMRDAKKIANEFTARLPAGRVVVSVTDTRKDTQWQRPE